MQITARHHLDETGRLVLPPEYGKILDWNEKDSVDIFLDEEQGKMTIRKSIPGCFLCKSAVELIQISRKYICVQCKQKLERVSVGGVIY